VADTDRAPAFYAGRSAGRAREWWSLLHPPYTMWHLSYVVIGACLAPVVDGVRLGATLVGFFCAVGIAAHALDELHGRPLRTRIPSWQLVLASVVSLSVSVTLGITGMLRVGPWLGAFVAAGVALVLAYNLELFGGIVHTDIGFAAAWGAFPVLCAYFVQARALRPAAVAAAGAAFALSWAQRALSSHARLVRRRVVRMHGRLELTGGATRDIDEGFLLAPVEIALRALSVGIACLAIALVVARFS
jgi:hypothetical protein